MSTLFLASCVCYDTFDRAYSSIHRACVYGTVLFLCHAWFASAIPGSHNPQVDLICCLASKHEDSGGGAGSLLNVYVADGTGFPAPRNPSAVVNRRDAALQKGMRAALGKPDWSPGNPHPTPYPAYLKVDVLANKKEVGLRCRVRRWGGGWGVSSYS